MERFNDLAGTQRIGRGVFDYDASGRTIDIQHLDALDAAIADYDYSYDLANQLIQEYHRNLKFRSYRTRSLTRFASW